MKRILLTAGILSFFFTACSSNKSANTPTPPPSDLSVQPHNRPASWEGTGGLGAAFGNQYQD